MLKKTLTAAALSAFVLTAAPAFAANQDITIHNKTGMDIQRIYVESTTSKDWGEDVLGEEVLAKGESVDVEFSGYGKECKFDLLVEDNNGKEWTVSGLNLCEISEFTLKKQGNKLVYTAD